MPLLYESGLFTNRTLLQNRDLIHKMDHVHNS
jgi:hypothetical protein